MEIIIYSKIGCPFCDLAKNWFLNQKLNFTEIQINDHEERQKFYEEIGEGIRTVPQIFLVKDGIKERIGGYTELLGKKDKFLSSKINLDQEF